MKISVFHWGAGYLLGGVERFVQDFADAAEQASAQTILVGVKDTRLTNYRQTTTAKQILLPFPHIHRMPNKRRREFLFSLLASPSALAADVVFAQGSQGIFASRFRPVVVFEHGPHQALTRNPRMFETARTIIVSTEWGRRHLEAARPDQAKKIAVLPIGTNVPNNPPQVRNNARHVLSVGVLDDPRKNFLGLINAFHFVVNQVPDARLTLAGNGAADPLRQACCDLGIESRVTVVCLDDRSDADAVLKALYHDADIFALNTKFETFGIVFIEAMSRGLPIVTNRVGPLEEVVEQNRAGFLATPGQPEEFASHLIALMRHHELFSEMAQRNRETALNRYDWRTLVHRYLSVFQDALEHERRVA